MSREEAVQKYEQSCKANYYEQARKEFDTLFRDTILKLKSKIVEAFSSLVEQCEKQKKEEIAYINLSFLRVHVLDGTYEWIMDAQDVDGYLDHKNVSVSLFLPELFTPLEAFLQKAKKDLTEYGLMLNEQDAEKLKLELFDSLLQYFYFGGSYWFRNITEEIAYQKLKKAPLFRILIGEYMGPGHLVHVRNQNIRKDEAFYKRLYSNVEENGFTKMEFAYSDLRKIVLEEECTAYKDFKYADLKECKMDDYRFIACNAIGINMEQADIRDSYFMCDVFAEGSFLGIHMKNTIVWSCYFAVGSYIEDTVMPGLLPIRFDGAVLEDVDFSFCDMRGCHFEQATLSHVKFEDTKLNGAVFKKEQVKELTFTKEQLEQIILL